MAWQSFSCPLFELDLRLLGVGQSFRWKKINSAVWQGVAHHRVWQLYQTDEKLFYRILGERLSGQSALLEPEAALKDYFQLSVRLTDLHTDWSKSDTDAYFLNVLKSQSGIRLLRQDPLECLFSFICSSNNNIKRISAMVENLCKSFGQAIDVDSKIVDDASTTFYDFPTLDDMTRVDAQNVDEMLRNLNFGYRSRYIAETAEKLSDFDENWLTLLRNKSYDESRSSLMQLSGVGGKVADCVCLMALDKTEAVPVDTHVLRITAERYLPELKKLKTPNDKTHKLIGNFYREKFGIYAGWAQAVLFANEV